MAKYNDALRGYAFQVHKRDQFKCRYCGLDGTLSFDAWLNLSLDHLLPPKHPNRNDNEFMVTACKFCNTADNLYFTHAKKRGLRFNNMSPADLVKQRKKYVVKTRSSYKEFWNKKVRVKSTKD
jgi:hypothetical protein